MKQEFTIAGKKLDLTSNKVVSALQNIEPGPIKTHAVEVNGLRYPIIQEYDSPEKCSAASESDLLEIAGVLGLFGRVIDIKRMSEALVCCYEGQVPGSVEKLLTLPSVGIYTANAVVCFAFGQRVPLVDANVIRVFTRLTGESSSKDNRRAQHVWKFAEDILPSHDVVSHNYGILDFAAETCKSKKPNHDSCPLRRLCRFYSVTSGVVTPSRSRYNDLKTGVRR